MAMQAAILAQEVIFRPVVSPMKIIAIAAVLAALVLWVYGRAASQRPIRAVLLAAMRLTAVAVLAVLLLGPSAQLPQQIEPTRSRLTILIDLTQSMLSDDGGDRARLERVVTRWLSPEQLAALREHYDVTLRGFDATTRSLDTTDLQRAPEQLASGRTTRYPDAVIDAVADLRGDADATLLLLGDGHDTERRPIQPAIDAARRAGATVHTVAVGGATAQRDIALLALARQETLLAGETGQIVAWLDQVGAAGQRTTLRIEGPNGAEARVVEFSDRATETLEIPIRHAAPGVYEYVLTAEPIEGEAVTENNRSSVYVEVSEERIEVLVLEGEPYWDTKFIAQALREDSRVALTQISQVNIGKRQSIVTRSADREAVVPRTVEQFSRYDVVVLGRGLERMLDNTALRALVGYVDAGGGRVIFGRGRAYDPTTLDGRAAGELLSPIEPVVYEAGLLRDRHLAITAAGLGNPCFTFSGSASDVEGMLARLPALQTIARVASLKPGTLVLARSRDAAPGAPATGGGVEGGPAIVTMAYGRGRVLAVLGEGMWRWSLLPPELREYEGVFEAFWSNAARWLAMGGAFKPGQEVSLNASRASVRRGDPQVVEVSLRLPPPAGFAPSLRAIDPSGDAQELSLTPVAGRATRWQATFEPREIGAWRIVLDAPPLQPVRQERRFSVYDRNLERLDTTARPEVLRELAEQTGGIAWHVDDDVELVRELQRRRTAQIAPPRERFIWDRGLILAVIVTWIGLEWVGRRQAGWL